jgi:hypothetical protein
MAGTKPRVCFIGNCQAQTLESLSGHLGVAIEVVTLPAVFQMDDFGAPATWDRIDSCDVVFNQRVSVDYPIEFARPDVLRRRLGQRAISWPNVYFDGYFPGIEYLYSHQGKIVGPLADYHLDFVRSAWAHDVPVDSLLGSFLSGRLAQEFRTAADSSLAQLRRREVGLDVRISDWICSRWRYSKLLHVMNHPDNSTLLELLQRLLRRAGIAAQPDPSLLASYPYALDEIRMPEYPAVRAAHALGFETMDTVVGKRVDFRAEGPVVTTEPCAYRWPDLFGLYYRLYDSICAQQPEAAPILRGTLPWKG